MKYATFRYDTVEVEIGLYAHESSFGVFITRNMKELPTCCTFFAKRDAYGAGYNELLKFLKIKRV